MMCVMWMVVLVLQGVLLTEGRVTGRFRRDTSLPNIQGVYNRYKTQSQGEATYYGIYPGGGACSLDPLSPLAIQPGWIRVAAGKDDFQNSLGCGMCLEIKGNGKGLGTSPVNGTLRGVVHDLCGGCKQGDLDLYIPGDGRWEISFIAIDCPTIPGNDGNIMLRFTGSNPWYIKLQARNTRVPVAGIEVLKNGKYSCLRRVGDNYFVGDGLGKVDFPMQVRMTAVTGEQREFIIPSMLNDQDTTTDVQFTGQATGSGPSSITCMGQGNKPPYPPGGLEPGDGPTPTPSRPPASQSNVVRPTPTLPTAVSNTSPAIPKKEVMSTAASADFCNSKQGGTYPDPDDCNGFIICNIGNTHRMKCAQGLMFNTKAKVCDLPERVNCGSRQRDDPPSFSLAKPRVQDKSKNGDEAVGNQVLPVHDVQQGLSETQNDTQDVSTGTEGKQANDQSSEHPDTHSKSSIKLIINQDSEENSLPDLSSLSAVTEAPKQQEPIGIDVKKVHKPSFHFGVVFKGPREESRKADASKSGKISAEISRPTLHLQIGENKIKGERNSDGEQDEGNSNARPSFELMVTNNNVKTRVQGERGPGIEKADESTKPSSEKDSTNSKPSLEFVIHHRKGQNSQSEVQANSGGIEIHGTFGGEGGSNTVSAKPDHLEVTVNNNSKDQETKQEGKEGKEPHHDLDEKGFHRQVRVEGIYPSKIAKSPITLIGNSTNDPQTEHDSNSNSLQNNPNGNWNFISENGTMTMHRQPIDDITVKEDQNKHQATSNGSLEAPNAQEHRGNKDNLLNKNTSEPAFVSMNGTVLSSVQPGITSNDTHVQTNNLASKPEPMINEKAVDNPSNESAGKTVRKPEPKLITANTGEDGKPSANGIAPPEEMSHPSPRQGTALTNNRQPEHQPQNFKDNPEKQLVAVADENKPMEFYSQAVTNKQVQNENSKIRPTSNNNAGGAGKYLSEANGKENAANSSIMVKSEENSKSLASDVVASDLNGKQGQEVAKAPKSKADVLNEDKVENSDTNREKDSTEGAKRPTVDLVLHDDSDGRTELRMSGNHLEREEDAVDGKSANRNPIIGVTLKHKGSPDHHILFSKRHKLISHNHKTARHHH